MKNDLNKVKLPSILKAYYHSDYALQLRARFVFSLGIIIILTLLSIIIARLVFKAYYADSQVASRVVISQLLLLSGMISGCLWLLIKGYYKLSAYLLPVLIMAIAWATMIFEKNSAIIRLNTVVYILVALSMTPLLLIRRKSIILIYTAINIAFLFVFMSWQGLSLGMSSNETIDCLIDISIALTLIGIVAYNSSFINEKALQQAMSGIKERIKAEDALVASERKFREMTDLLPQAVYEMDLDGNLTYLNRSGLQMFGYADEDIIAGMTLFSILTETERVKANIQEVIKGTRVGNQYTARRKNGDTLTVKAYSSTVVENDQVIGIRGIIIDISDTIKAEQALAKSERKFREMAELLPQTLYESDLQGKLNYINKAGTDMFGYSPDEVHAGLSVFEAIASEDHQRLKENITNIVAGLPSHGNQYTALRKDGTTFPIQIYSSVIREENVPVGFRGIIFDVSALMKANEDIQKRDKLFRDMVESSPISITLTTMDSKLILANQRFFKETGLSPEKAAGKTPWELGLKLNMEIEEHFMQVMKEKGHVENFESLAYFENNIIHYLYVYAAIVDVENQKAILRYNFNVTEKKMLENQIREYNLKLEDLVNERTATLASTMEELQSANEELQSTNDELYRQREQLEMMLQKLKETQEQLIQQEKMASLGILTAGVAHEINNPINYIYNGSVAIENYISENIPEHLENLKPLFDAINTGVTRTTNIVKSLSRYSRKESVAFHKCQIHQILENCLTMLYNQYKNRIEIKKEFDDNLPETSANESTLHQAFLNILTNAIQAIDKEGMITIRTKIEKETISISISDNGKGMKEEDLTHIFDPFFTTKDPGIGTGLGLSIVQRIIKEHNGSINCESRLNHGTEFIVNLPVSQEL